MAPVLSFIHVVIVHINVHHPSYTNYYRACPDWRPGLHHLPIPQTVYMPGPLHHCQIILFVTGRGCSPRSIHTHSGARQLQTVHLCLKSFHVPLKDNQNWCSLMPQSQNACTEGESQVTSTDIWPRPTAAGLSTKVWKKKHSGETVGWPASTASIKARVLWKPEDSESTGHPLTTQRVTYAKN